jgi:hypothetical protein
LSLPSWITTLSRIRRTLRATLDLAFGDDAAGNLADLGDVEHLEDFRVAEEGLAPFGASMPDIAAFTSSTRS